MAENRQIVVASLPTGRLAPSDFSLRVGAMPEPGEGQVLCRTLAITIGAGQRAGLQGSAGYAGAPETGRVMGGTGVARVEASRAPGFSVGDLVVGPTGWQDWSVHAPRALSPVEGGGDPALHLGVLGPNALTAWVGVEVIGRPQPGETVVVSAAAGSVGHVAGQIARIRGCRVVGVAGSDDKCGVLTHELGFDAAVNYRRDDFRDAFRAACRDGIDIYFDNTGGDILGAALRRMKPHGRIVCCGVVSQYDTSNPEPGPRGIPGLLINNRVRMEGFLYFDHGDRLAEARQDLRSWVDDGRLTAKVDRHEGLDAAPAAFVGLLAGHNVGTVVVHVAD
jgi:NADPH-dependent curcumin reductase CurA